MGILVPMVPLRLAAVLAFLLVADDCSDHYSRRVVGFTIFRQVPTSVAVRACLGRAIASVGAAPRYVVSDKGSQYWPSRGYRRWCRRRGIRPRFGAIGKHGSIAVIERALRTFKEALQRLTVPTRRTSMQREMVVMLEWYNQHRPHTTLGGKTPDEVYYRRFPANRKPRLEPRAKWARKSRCAGPQTLVAGKPGHSICNYERFTV